MKVLLFASYFEPGFRGGGPIKTIKNLFRELGTEISFKLITSDRDLGDVSPYTSVDCGRWNRIYNTPVFYAQRGITGYRQMANELCSRNYDLVYLNSFFSPRFAFFPLLLAKALRQKALLAPRGEFSEGALTSKSTKKSLFISVFKFLGLHRDTVFQASSEYEAQDIRKALGTKIDVRIAENIGAQDFAVSIPADTGVGLKLVFISRISPKKNLFSALEMLERVKHPLLYHIYGPIEDSEYWEKCKSLIASLPAHIRVEHKGELHPDEVVNKISEYDAFFMPTKGENYGHVIAEALCAGLPILIANTTPWRNLQKKGIGWDLPLNNTAAFSDVIDQLAVMSAEEHRKMRETVLSWAKLKFSQRDAVEANIAMFRYVYEKK